MARSIPRVLVLELRDWGLVLLMVFWYWEDLGRYYWEDYWEDLGTVGKAENPYKPRVIDACAEGQVEIDPRKSYWKCWKMLEMLTMALLPGCLCIALALGLNHFKLSPECFHVTHV